MSWSWSTSNQSGYGVTRTVRTTNGQQVVTTTYGGQPQSTCPSRGVVKSCNTPASTTCQQSSGTAPAAATHASTFEQQSLDEHNRLRALHGCPPLTLNRNLCAYATEWANHLSSRNTMQHRTDRKYGENIFMAMGSAVDGKRPVKDWYNEIAQYNYGRPGFSSGTGHFTQVVWKGSKELGVGFATRGSTTYVVANYSPPGNSMNDFGANVPRRIQ